MTEIEGIINGFLNVPLSKVIIAILIITLAVLLNKIIVSKLFNILIKIGHRTNTNVDDSIIKAMVNPAKFLVVFYGIYYALIAINLDGFSSELMSTAKFIKIALVIVICYFLYNLTLENSILYKRIRKNEEGNRIVFPFVSIIIRLTIIIVAVIIIAQEFGFTGFIAGLGISGVAFALAAQDTFSNLVGGMVIVLDKPFAIGDWIQTSEVEGTIEEITFRSTKIRTFSMALATVPNSKLANSNIINWTQRDRRRIHFKFTIKYETSVGKIESIVRKIESTLKQHEKIHKDMVIVSFNELSSYGFGIFIYFYTQMIDYVSYERLKQEINIKILEILKSEQVELMFFNFNFNLGGVENRPSFCEADCAELESIDNITEEERGI